jgi:molecular chaperone GrpE (heat shock protein)
VTQENRSDEGNPEQVTITDKRRIDPETGEVRQVPPGSAPGEAAPAASAGVEAQKTEAEIAELTADLQRVQADFANYRKRALRDQQAATDRAKASVVSQLLGVLDDLERARTHGDLESGPLKLVADKLDGALTGLGLEAFGAEGEDLPWWASSTQSAATPPPKPERPTQTITSPLRANRAQNQDNKRERRKGVTRYGPARMGRKRLLQGAGRLL